MTSESTEYRAQSAPAQHHSSIPVLPTADPISRVVNGPHGSDSELSRWRGAESPATGDHDDRGITRGNTGNKPSPPVRVPNRAAESAGVVLVTNEAMAATLRMWRESAEYRELLERTRDGLIALDSGAESPAEPSPEDGERLQREVDGVIARWRAAHPGARHAC